MNEGMQNKAQFVHAIVRGLGGNFRHDRRAKFAEQVLGWGGIRPPDPKNVLNNYYDAKIGNFSSFVGEAGKGGAVTIDEMKNPLAPPLVATAGIQRDIDLIGGWLERGDPFILVGPEGCGKNLIIT